MLPDRVSNPGPLTYESGALPIAQMLTMLLHQNRTANVILSDGFVDRNQRLQKLNGLGILKGDQ